MPELPEVHGAARLINQVATGRFFRGPIVRSAVSKPAPFEWNSDKFRLEASSRGKEMQMILKDEPSEGKTLLSDLKLTFNFGMSGMFSFDRFDQIPKHAHLQFTTTETPPNVLSFVDYRRFGKWVIRDYDETRGPDPVFEYKDFRHKVLSNLDKTPFSKAICETIMDQDYFNGIGNYLRAEIIFRAKVPPFTMSRNILENLPVEHDIDTANPDILDLCHIVPKEVFGLGKPGQGYLPSSDGYTGFKKWLQCYMVHGMKTLVDRQSRTVWFSGPAGPLVPPQKTVRHKRTKLAVKSEDGSRVVDEEDADEANTVRKDEVSDAEDQPSTSRTRRKAATKNDLVDEESLETPPARKRKKKTKTSVSADRDGKQMEGAKRNTRKRLHQDAEPKLEEVDIKAVVKVERSVSKRTKRKVEEANEAPINGKEDEKMATSAPPTKKMRGTAARKIKTEIKSGKEEGKSGIPLRRSGRIKREPVV